MLGVDYKFLIIMKLKTYFFTFTAIVSATCAATEMPHDTLSLDEFTLLCHKNANVALLPFNHTTVTAQMIEESAESTLLPIIATSMPGVFVSERGYAGYGVSSGAAGAVNIRGIGQSNKVLFLIDGQPQWAGVFGHSIADTYGVEGVADVQVVRGPASLLYGSNAMGGAINIISERPKKDGYYGSARGMIGSFSTQKFNLMTGMRSGKVSANISAQVDHSNGNRANSEFWSANEYAQFGYAVSEAWQVGTNIYLTQSTANYPGTTYKPIMGMWTNIFRYSLSAHARNKYTWGEGSIHAYINHGRHKIDDGYAEEDVPSETLFRCTDYNSGITMQQTVHPWHSSNITAGASWQHWGGHTWRTNKSDGQLTEGIRKSEDEYGLFALWQQTVVSQRLEVNGGVRWQHGSAYGNVWIPQAGLTVHPLSESAVRFSFSKGFRAPNIRELYIGTEANKDLSAEYLYNYDVTIEKRMLNKRLHLAISLFLIDALDMIQIETVDGRQRNMNTGSFTNKGFEVECKYLITDRLTLSANYSYLHTTSEKLLAAPKNMLNTEANFTPGNFAVTVQTNSVWRLNTGADKLQDYTLLNMRIAFRHRISPFVKVDNITNKRYEIVYGCPMPGTTVIGGVQIKF